MKINPLKLKKLKINPLQKLRKKSTYSKKIGLPAGQILYIGDREAESIEIKIINYSEAEYKEKQILNLADIETYFDPNYINWIDIDGINDAKLMEDIANRFNFHPLMTEDIMNTEHLPKSEEYDAHHFFTLKMLRLNNEHEESTIVSEHVSIVLGPRYVITFQDKVKGDVFDLVRMRIHNPKSKLRRNGADFLLYALIDAIVDQYFVVMEFIREQIEELEDFVIENPSEKYIDHIIAIKKQLTNIRKVVLPLNDAIDRLYADESEFIGEEAYTYFRDVQDHLRHLTSSFEGYRDSVTSLMDMYMSNLSNNLNVIMKTLTIFSLFFVPLTFVAGVYGMNFQYMPELGWKYGYPMVLIIMLGSIITMFIYMRRKKWL